MTDREHESKDTIDTSEIMSGSVHSGQTISPSTPIPIRELLVYQQTNFHHEGVEIEFEKVRQLQTIFYSTSEGRKVIEYMIENPAFSVVVLRADISIKKQTAYDILSQLSWLVEKTRFKIDHPNPSTPGPRPHIWKIIGANEIHIKQARIQFNLHQRTWDPELKHKEKLKRISLLIADQFIRSEYLSPSLQEILKKVMNVPTSRLHFTDRNTVSGQVNRLMTHYRKTGKLQEDLI